jgi:hypothetical protein
MSFANESKNTVTYYPYTKAGQGSIYDSNIPYDAELDPISGNPVYYDSIGTTPTFSNNNKSSTSYSNQSKT